MERIRLAGLSWKAEVAAVIGAIVASVVSFVSIVALYASASGELDVVIANVRAAPAASALAVQAPRKPKPG